MGKVKATVSTKGLPAAFVEEMDHWLDIHYEVTAEDKLELIDLLVAWELTRKPNNKLPVLPQPLRSGVLHPSPVELAKLFTDITEPRMPVEITTSDRGVLWVNVGPVCVLRICRIDELMINGKKVAPRRTHRSGDPITDAKALAARAGRLEDKDG